MVEEMKDAPSLDETSDNVTSPSSVQDICPKALAEMALEHYNRAARISLRKEYEFVTEKCTSEFHDSGGKAYWYHLNFTARPTSESQDFTFFAEIKEATDDVFHVMKCEIIGPTDQVSPSLNGCIACEKMYRKRIAHPATGVVCTGKFLRF